MNELMNYKGVCKIAPAAMDLLKTENISRQLKSISNHFQCFQAISRYIQSFSTISSNIVSFSIHFQHYSATDSRQFRAMSSYFKPLQVMSRYFQNFQPFSANCQYFFSEIPLKLLLALHHFHHFEKVSVNFQLFFGLIQSLPAIFIKFQPFQALSNYSESFLVFFGISSQLLLVITCCFQPFPTIYYNELPFLAIFNQTFSVISRHTKPLTDMFNLFREFQSLPVISNHFQKGMLILTSFNCFNSLNLFLDVLEVLRCFGIFFTYW